MMECLPRETFRLAISAGVMEHIPASTAAQFVSTMALLLVGNGFGMHGINIHFATRNTLLIEELLGRSWGELAHWW
jgi:hypothetical protein